MFSLFLVSWPGWDLGGDPCPAIRRPEPSRTQLLVDRQAHPTNEAKLCRVFLLELNKMGQGIRQDVEPGGEASLEKSYIERRQEP